MTTLITGGTGFLGRHLIDRLIADGATDLRVLSRSDQPELSELGIDVVCASLDDDKALADAVKDVDRVYHLAGRVERDRSKAHLMYALHVDGTTALLDALRHSDTAIKKIVVASTSGTVGVGKTADFMATDNSPHAEPIVRDWPYYLSKIYAERICFDYVERYELPIVLMRPTLLLGPGDRRESSTGDVVLFMKQKMPGIIDGGLSFVDVRDTAAAFVKAMERGQAGDTYLLGAANMTLAQFFKRLEAISGIAAPTVKIPTTLAKLGGRFLNAATSLGANLGDIDPVSLEMARHYWYIDSTKARTELDWTPRAPDQTLRDTLNWIEANHPDFSAPAGRRRTPPPELVPPETVEYAKELRREQGLNF